jgi:hypothetical protein
MAVKMVPFARERHRKTWRNTSYLRQREQIIEYVMGKQQIITVLRKVSLTLLVSLWTMSGFCQISQKSGSRQEYTYPKEVTSLCLTGEVTMIAALPAYFLSNSICNRIQEQKLLSDSYDGQSSIPKWIPYAVSGSVLAVGAIIFGCGKVAEYKYRVEVNKKQLMELCFVPTGIVLRF